MKVLLIGITGQTSAYLAKLLIDNGSSVTGTSRDKNRATLINLEKVGVDLSDLNILSLNPSDPRQVFSLLANSNFDAIINLAGQTSVGLSFQQPAEAFESITSSCLNFIEAIKALRLKAIYFNASSSECFGNTDSIAATEDTPFRPNSPYAAAKASAFYISRIAREAYGIHAISGILSNHESALRGPEFVTKKIIRELHEVKLGIRDSLVLGNVDTIRDWGFAPDYAKAIMMMINSRQAEDFIVATGKSYSLRDFIKTAAHSVGITQDFDIVTAPEFVRPLDVDVSRLSPKKIQTQIGWKPSVTFDEMVDKLVQGSIF